MSSIDLLYAVISVNAYLALGPIDSGSHKWKDLETEMYWSWLQKDLEMITSWSYAQSI